MRRRGAAAVLMGLAVLGTACGTRLPDSAFVAAGQAAGGAGTGLVGGSAGGTGASAGGSGVPGTAGGSGGGGTVAVGGAGAGAGSGAGAAAAGTVRGSGKTGSTPNTASDVGVTPTTIRVGIVDSISNAFDPAAFVGAYYGARAFYTYLDQHGGVNGRAVQLYLCDDKGDATQDQTCVRNLVTNTKVFAFSSNAIFDYTAASYVQSVDVPDIGAQPISDAYFQYSHLYSLYGGLSYPRNGQIGFNGTLYGGTEVFRYFKEKFPNVPLKAGVVYYNESASQAYAQYLIEGLKDEGYQVDAEEVDFALPDFNSAVIHMKAQGVQYVYDIIDVGGNEALCKAMDSNGLYATKVTTTESWTADIKQAFSASPRCRNDMWATGNTLNYEDTSYPEVAEFQQAMSELGYNNAADMSEWALEGWAGAQWLTDAMSSCGADLTRKCVEAYMNRHAEYTAHGLFTPRDFIPQSRPAKTVYNCINVVRWQDSAYGGRGGWVTQVPNMNTNCFNVPNIPYAPS